MSSSAHRDTGHDHAAAGPGPDRLWSVQDHLDDVLATVRPLDPIELNLLDAQGCVLVDDITVPLSLPPFDNSSMDGYAVRVTDVAGASEEFPAVLEVVGDVAAGQTDPIAVGPGQAARIMTGAPLPPGAEAVVPVEWTDGGSGEGPVAGMRARSLAPEGAEGHVQVYRPAEERAHVRAKGSDVRSGDRALAAGTVLGPPQIGLLAAIGRGTVRVRPRPRVVVLSTGSELVQPDEQLAPGQIYDSNSFALTAAARDAGAIAYRVGAVADDAETLRATIEDQLVRADLMVTTGGVSVGAYDVVKEALAHVGDEDEPGGGVDFRKLAMQPGKPQGFGSVGPDHTPLLALPGNPVSSYVSFELFVRPAIRTLMGLPDVHRPTVTASLAADKALTSPKGRRQFLRGSHAGGSVTPVGGSGSHLVAALAQANALIVVPEDTESVEPGTEVEVVLLG
ncbi:MULTISPECIES: gephyrin-like molybdotransferase Glp [Streptomyces]|uniref:Molybdopterin molybdenumtransferase n=3 Tax=Streptomyces TaxID=1883 RepID=A0A7U9DW68_STRLI|nr:molybdopterin biosynthesis protein [Streptomyces lividans TK24]EOY48248.1 putative molybdopterin biosynthesis protein [Streptomyces lividans 1326]KKD12242.1 molybdopterin biosynthesis protein MoeA [Streptomyces sp. WM6391]QSJ10860.1 molybdopterin biosynthesis protein [Streptomyces lividans]TYP07425.1 molybdopterin molybdochelatase [Streptomyces coelicolor]TYP09261.1 molybdopterin molybdochelatase [Streptomyces coelicolor A3(2)]GGL59021.1 molybdopterin molybdenumtransferase MoeA [Streptomyc